jgi:hypothetical protein
MVNILAYLRPGLHCFLDEDAALCEVVGHAGRRGQLTHGLCATSEGLSAWAQDAASHEATLKQWNRTIRAIMSHQIRALGPKRQELCWWKRRRCDCRVCVSKVGG